MTLSFKKNNIYIYINYYTKLWSYGAITLSKADGFSRLCQDWTTTFVTGLAREGDLQKNHTCTCNTNVYKHACMRTPTLVKKNNTHY